MKNGSLKGFAIAGALATLVAPAAAFAGKAGASSKMVKCEGANDCKGKGACKGGGHDCQGKNSCKGKGFVESSSAKECKAMGGKPRKMKPMRM